MLSYTTPLMFFPNKSGGNSKDLSLQSTVLHVTFAIGHSGDTVKPKQTFFFCTLSFTWAKEHSSLWNPHFIHCFS